MLIPDLALDPAAEQVHSPPSPRADKASPALRWMGPHDGDTGNYSLLSWRHFISKFIDFSFTGKVVAIINIPTDVYSDVREEDS